MPIIRVFMGLILFPAEPHKRAQEYSPAWNQQVLNLVFRPDWMLVPRQFQRHAVLYLGTSPRAHTGGTVSSSETLAWRHDPPAVSPAPP